MADWTEHKAVVPTIGLAKWVLTLIVAYQLAVLTWMVIDQPVLVLPEPSKGKATQAAKQNYDMASQRTFSGLFRQMGFYPIG